MAADVLLIASEGGLIHISIYDLFEIGTFECSRTNAALKIKDQCSHDQSSSYGIILSYGHELLWTLLDVKVLSTNNQLAIVAAKSAQMTHLIRYCRLAITQMQAELRTSFELPKRFISSLEESYDASGNNWLSAAYELILTGHCDEATKEWLTTILGERVRSSMSMTKLMTGP